MKSTPPIELAICGLVAIASLAIVGCQPPNTLHGGSNSIALGGGGSDIPDNSPIIRAMPQAGGAKAPAIVKPGLRLIYRWGAATIPGEGLNFQEDPDGNWVDGNGKHYNGINKGEGTGGGGFAEYTVVAMGDTAAISILSYGFGLNTAPSFLSRSVGGGQAGFGGGTWAPPEMLQQLPAQMGGGFDVMKMPYHLPTGNVDAVWIKTSGTQSYEADVYSPETGLLIHVGSAGVSTVAPVHAENQNNTGNLMLTDTTLMKVDQINTPWSNDPAPDWVNNLHRMEYQGTNIVNAGMEMRSPATLTLEVIKQRDGWTMMKQSNGVSIGGNAPIVTEQQIVTGPQDFGAPWISPAGLARLQAGQTLDTDQFTQVVTKVEGQQNGPKGPVMVISQQNGSGGVYRGYDMKTGAMVVCRVFDINLHSDTTYNLTSQS